MNTKLITVTLITLLNSTNHSTNWIIWILGIIVLIVVVFCIIKHRPKLPTPESKTTSEPQIVEPKTPQKPLKPNVGKAKEAFLKNIDKFCDLLDDLISDKPNLEKWTDSIIDLNNQDLMDLWRLVFDKPISKWTNILASWGVKHDNCQSFEGSNYHKEMYLDENKNEIEIGMNYDVMLPCWILTSENVDGKTTKKVIKTGIARKIMKNENV